MAVKTRIIGREKKVKRKPGRPPINPQPKVKEKPDPNECIGVFPTNEERIAYRDEMASRNYL